MPKQQTDHLIELIHSLTKAEKRSFRLFANRQQHTDDKLFILLFDFIEGTKDYKESELLKKFPQIRKSQLSNIKANLMKQLLSVLRLLQKDFSESVNVTELIDHAHIFQSKGMHKAGLEMLEKAKRLSERYDDPVFEYLALDQERKTESSFITGRSALKTSKIMQHSEALLKKIILRNELANLSLRLYAMYLRFGYVKDEKDHSFIRDFYESHLPELNEETLSFYEKIYLCQSRVWYYHMSQDFLNYFKFSKKWVDTFDGDTRMIRNDIMTYLKGRHNVLNALYMSGKAGKFVQEYNSFILFGANNQKYFSASELSDYMLFANMHLLNKIFLTGHYDEGLKEIEPLVTLMKNNTWQWDENRLITFNYKIACVWFGADKYNEALDYLNAIINNPDRPLGQDIQCFARILSLISHYELGNDVLVSYQIKSVYRYLSKMENLQSVQLEILSFLRKTPNLHPKDLKKAFTALRTKLTRYQHHPFEKRPFLYLDIIAWLDSKISGKRIQAIIRERVNASLS
jgi:hypothetical protein